MWHVPGLPSSPLLTLCFSVVLSLPLCKLRRSPAISAGWSNHIIYFPNWGWRTRKGCYWRWCWDNRQRAGAASSLRCTATLTLGPDLFFLPPSQGSTFHRQDFKPPCLSDELSVTSLHPNLSWVPYRSPKPNISIMSSASFPLSNLVFMFCKRDPPILSKVRFGKLGIILTFLQSWQAIAHSSHPSVKSGQFSSVT